MITNRTFLYVGQTGEVQELETMAQSPFSTLQSLAVNTC